MTGWNCSLVECDAVSARILTDVEKWKFKFSKSADVLDDINEVYKMGEGVYRLVAYVKGTAQFGRNRKWKLCLLPVQLRA
jgi:hypothetical protein